MHSHMHNTVAVGTTHVLWGGAPDPLRSTQTWGIETLWIKQDHVSSGTYSQYDALWTQHANNRSLAGSIPVFCDHHITQCQNLQTFSVWLSIGKTNIRWNHFIQGSSIKRNARTFSEFHVNFLFLVARGQILFYKLIVLAQTSCYPGMFAAVSTNRGLSWYGEGSISEKDRGF